MGTKPNTIIYSESGGIGLGNHHVRPLPGQWGIGGKKGKWVLVKVGDSYFRELRDITNNKTLFGFQTWFDGTHKPGEQNPPYGAEPDSTWFPIRLKNKNSLTKAKEPIAGYDPTKIHWTASFDPTVRFAGRRILGFLGTEYVALVSPILSDKDSDGNRKEVWRVFTEYHNGFRAWYSSAEDAMAMGECIVRAHH